MVLLLGGREAAPVDAVVHRGVDHFVELVDLWTERFRVEVVAGVRPGGELGAEVDGVLVALVQVGQVVSVGGRDPHVDQAADELALGAGYDGLAGVGRGVHGSGIGN